MFSFQGTISRPQFWLGNLAVGLAGVLVSLPPAFVPGLGLFFVFSLYGLHGLLYWVIATLHARRLRDAGLSPWLCVLLFVPLAGVAVFLVAGFKPTKTTAPDPSAYKDSPVWKFLHPEDMR